MAPHQRRRWSYLKKRDIQVLFLRKAHYTEHPSLGCTHLVLITQLSRLKQFGKSVLLKDKTH